MCYPQRALLLSMLFYLNSFFLCEQGVAHTFFTSANAKGAHDLVKILRESKQTIPPELERLTSSSGGGSYDRGTRIALTPHTTSRIHSPV
jgi:hypothetical protein